MHERYVLLGEGVSDSPSRAMMNSAFHHLGLDSTYEIANVAPADLPMTFARLADERVSGMNVTIPHKSSICPLLEETDDLSRKTGAVNTVKRKQGKYIGFNTDVTGIIKPLGQRGVRQVDRAVAIGTGGAARAFCAAMDQLRCRELTLLSRRPAAKSEILEKMTESFPRLSIEVSSMEDPPPGAPDLLFNASPIGSRGIPTPPAVEGLLGSKTTVFDAVYFPVDTQLVRAATRIGCPVVRGHEMLLAQGAEAFRIWTGLDPPEQIMSRSLLNSLEVAAE